MKIRLEQKTIITNYKVEFIDITKIVERFITDSDIQNGLILIMSKHTTTGIIVNEGLPDIESDIAMQIERLVPEDMPYYRHARFLHSDGQMAINASSHIKGTLLGFEAAFPIKNKELFSGKRQTIYFVELDGPQERTYIMQAIGE